MFTKPSRREFIATSAALSAITVVPSALAQTASTTKWPNKQIRIVVAFPPGGLTDSYARMYAEQLTTKFGVPVVVDNKPGAGAIIGIDSVAKSAADGYTLLMTTSGTVWQNRVLYNKLPYNLDKDLVPIATFPSGPLIVGVSEKVPAKNMREFIDFAKKNPANMGTYAPGSIPHMAADQINRSDGTKIVPVHYRGESPMWVDLASGQIQIAIGSYQSFATVQARGVRPIAVLGQARSPKLPDVPTLVEQGFNSSFYGLEGGLPLLAPAGTPEAVLKALSSVVVEGANTERAAKLRESFAIPNKPQNLVDTRKEWDRVIPIWIKIAVDLGIKLD